MGSAAGKIGLIALLIGFSALAVEPGKIYQNGVLETSLEQALKAVRPGQVIIIGEEHGTREQANQQVQVMQKLRDFGLKVSVGMEFFDFTQQKTVDLYRTGQILEPEFLNLVNWGQGFPFEAYRDQVLFPAVGSEFLIALNAPRGLTSRISKVGWEGLNDDEKSLLPPGLGLGNDRYLARFNDAMGGHVPPAALTRYFQAQCTWDDTMAYSAQKFITENPDQVLVIVVGEFHVQYGGGLPDRLRIRGIEPITFSLINLEGMAADEIESSVLPSSLDGIRADFIWTSKFARP